MSDDRYRKPSSGEQNPLPQDQAHGSERIYSDIRYATPNTYCAAIGSDHAGYALQQAMVAHWKGQGEQPLEMGTTSTDSVDYPLFAASVCKALQQGSCERGLLFCNSGIGMAIAANRFPGIRAVWADRTEIVEHGRRHNNANVLCIAAKWTNLEQLIQLWQTFTGTPFDGGERHVRRIQLMDL